MEYEKLTVETIRKRFWDPITKKGLPIKYFSTQDYDPSSKPIGVEWYTMTPTGCLIECVPQKVVVKHPKGGYTLNCVDGSGLKIHDWLSNDTLGPYYEDGSNDSIYYYLEFETHVGIEKVQIGCGKKGHVNNYITYDALDAIDCWIVKE